MIKRELAPHIVSNFSNGELKKKPKRLTSEFMYLRGHQQGYLSSCSASL